MKIFRNIHNFLKRSGQLSQIAISILRGDDLDSIQSSTGITVNSYTASCESAVMSCVRVLSESVAQLPLKLYEQKGRTKTVVNSHPVAELLRMRPNRFQTSFTMRETGQANLCLNGNAYFWKTFDTAGNITEIIPLNPEKVRPFCYTKEGLKYYHSIKPEGKIAFEVNFPDANNVVLLRNEVLHIPGLSFNGLYGLNPIEYMAETVGLSLAARTFGAKLFSNGARPQGVLEVPKSLSDKAYERLKNSWSEKYAGLSNSHKTALLEEGAQYKPIQMSSKDAQYLELRKFGRSEIAGIYRVPAHLINDLEHATFSNVEHLGGQFVYFSLTPWITRWENQLDNDLLTMEERRRGLFIKFQEQALLRGDNKSRSEFYRSGITNGWMTRNEAREKEDLNPIDGADELLVPLNMQSGTKPSEQEEKNSIIKGADKGSDSSEGGL